MLNTCSIGRRWKSREGWSRPVLTGERGTLFPIPWLGDWVSSCGGFLVGWQGTLFLVVAMTILVRRLSFASVVRFPDRHDRNRGWFRCRPIRVVGRSEWFCGGHGPGETPGPFPNPEAKAWHGDGTALERVWESSAPPHSTVWTFWSSPLGDSRKVPFVFPLGVPAGRNAPGTPILFCFAGQPAGAHCPGCRKACPVSGRLGLFRAPKGNFCCSTKTSGEQILFSERAFDTVYDTVF